jgi:arsenite-transporting ATPase
MYFGLYGFTVDAVLVNRLLPDDVSDPFFRKWRKTQEQFLDEARRYFDPVPIWTLPLFDDQVVGAESLRRLGRELYGERDPAASYLVHPPYRYAKSGASYILKLEIPFVEKDEVELAVASGDLIVRIGNVRHHIPIPRTLAGASPSAAKVENGKLTVRFGKARGDAPARPAERREKAR